MPFYVQTPRKSLLIFVVPKRQKSPILDPKKGTVSLGGVPTTPDPNTFAKVSQYKWEAYRDTNWWCIYYFCQEGGILLQKYRDRNGRCIAVLFKSIGVRGWFDSPDSLWERQFATLYLFHAYTGGAGVSEACLRLPMGTRGVKASASNGMFGLITEYSLEALRQATMHWTNSSWPQFVSGMPKKGLHSKTHINTQDFHRIFGGNFACVYVCMYVCMYVSMYLCMCFSLFPTKRQYDPNKRTC